MSRLSGRVSWMLAGMAIVVLMAEVAEAQREGGRRGRGGRGGFGRNISSVQLVAESEEVRTALNVTPDQQEKIETINDELRDARREAFGGGGGGGDFRAAMEEMEKLNQEASGKLAEVLEDDQEKRLLGIHCIGTGATELVHVGQAVLALGGGLDYFLGTVFNYPTLAECYKVAALDAFNKLRA